MVAALLDTSVLVAVNKPGETAPDLDDFDELFVSSLSYTELRMGLYTVDGESRIARHDLLEDLITHFRDGVPYDDAAAVAYGRIVRQAVANGGRARSHVLDRMIAAVAVANGLTLVTRNGADLRGLESLVDFTVR
ncbi:PIN domain-containing protein [Gordonia sp. VNQ95]|jgi:predicted nucleic acid-binding protein|uniref:type II toxin-antitoxin system VapC family toxin n=1 Tax=Gordonia TaxID=2053 RepID=UPI0032B3B9E9